MCFYMIHKRFEVIHGWKLFKNNGHFCAKKLEFSSFQVLTSPIFSHFILWRENASLPFTTRKMAQCKKIQPKCCQWLLSCRTVELTSSPELHCKNRCDHDPTICYHQNLNICTASAQVHMIAQKTLGSTDLPTCLCRWHHYNLLCGRLIPPTIIKRDTDNMILLPLHGSRREAWWWDHTLEHLVQY